jgi:hypothetical protein
LGESEAEHKKHAAEEKAYLEGLKLLDKEQKKRKHDGVP